MEKNARPNRFRHHCIVRKFTKLHLLPLLLSLLLAPTALAIEFKARVIRVSDGDTIQVLRDKSPLRIRLNGIDCPEKSQAFGNRAKQFTANLCFRKQVSIQDLGQDRYGRTIGEVTLPDGRSLNQELVSAGYAWWYRKYAPDNETLKKLESQARENHRGLWSDPNPIPPWDFRHQPRH